MSDNSNLKVPIFTGINDTPVAPTEDTEGNGSHLIDLYNSLVDEYTTTINNLTNQLSQLQTHVGNLGNSSSDSFTTILTGNTQYIAFYMAVTNLSVSKLIVRNQPDNFLLEFLLDGDLLDYGTTNTITDGYEIIFDTPIYMEAANTLIAEGDEFGTNQIEVTVVFA